MPTLRVAHTGMRQRQVDLDRAIGYLLEQLEAYGIMDDTVIAICADHYPYGLDNEHLSELYGYEVTNTVLRDHNRLILWCGCLEDEDPIIVDTPTTSLDMLPTLLNLFGIEYDSRLLPGRDVFSDAMPLYFNAGYDWRTDLGTYLSGRATFYPDDPDAEIPEGYVEAVRTIVANRINYCSGVLNSNYFRYLFGDPNGDYTQYIIDTEPVRIYEPEQPVESQPADTVPVETVPVDTAPAETVPADTVPVDQPADPGLPPEEIPADQPA